MAASQALVTFYITSSTFSSADDPSVQPPSIQRRMASALKALAFQPVNYFVFGGRFSDSPSLFCISPGTMITHVSVQVSDTLQQVLPLRKPLLTNVRSIIELASPLMKVGFSPSLSSVKSSTEKASKSVCPPFFVSLLPHPTAQALKSPAMATGLRFQASSPI